MERWKHRQQVSDSYVNLIECRQRARERNGLRHAVKYWNVRPVDRDEVDAVEVAEDAAVEVLLPWLVRRADSWEVW